MIAINKIKMVVDLDVDDVEVELNLFSSAIDEAIAQLESLREQPECEDTDV